MIVDADKDTAAELRALFEFERFSVSVAESGARAIEQLDGRVDAVLLELSLLEMSLARVCRTIRKSSEAWLIALAEIGTESAIKQGFDAGLDDYIVKPLRPDVLVSRVRARVRRSKRREDARRFGDLIINPSQAEACIGNRRVALTRTELRLLSLLTESTPRALSRREIMEHLWGSSHVGDQHACEVHISNLRRKIEEEPTSPKRLVTVRGSGYAFVPHH